MATRRAKLGPKQRKLLDFLRNNAGKIVTEAALLSATTYGAPSFRVNLGNGHFDPYLSAVGGRKFKVTASADLDERAFYRQVSQTAAHRELGAGFRHPLAKKLVQKARDNFILALELYNRPSLENRLDAFAQLFCTSWEQLLKAELLEEHGDEKIFKKQKEGRRRETISLQKAIEFVLPEKNDFVRLNLERIAELRHEATHLLMQETAAPISQLFQAGVINFASRFREVTGEALLPESAAGLLSLVGAADVATAVDLKKLYGELTGGELANLRSELEAEIVEHNDKRFAVTIDYRLVLTNKEGEADISLSAAAGSGPTLGMIEKPVPAEKIYRHLTQEVAAAVALSLGRKFSTYDLQAVLHKEKWKNGNNKFHHSGEKVKTHLYSDACIEEILSKVTRQPRYLDGAKRGYKRSFDRARGQR